ncbi:2-polyprenyl-6-methoxyphenol hydroxylase [Oleomonas cavernae]|uniref:2-polyprenyl-6-methoxyphenol hydroxylase n=1 Tax=Oleomonas cavernae TaxID=2320859 RepID=A0A418WGY8_9PROT|nr:FAD-dependent monooxygenase [Oleomonas cavernae]RJF89304.1 2-polyprenyl-6-methoxyphenol hydroxylase [Oleomonas cavernae]
MIQVPIVIVGGGPIGMTLALALAQQGVRSVLFNAREETTTHPRLDVVNVRSMEIYRRLGIDNAIRTAGNPIGQHQNVMVSRSYVGDPIWTFGDELKLMGSTLRNREIIAERHKDGTYPLEPMHRVAQMRLEPVLKSLLDANPLCEVLFGWEVHDIEENANGVVVHAEHVRTGKQRTVFGEYAVGCDGPDSGTRKRLGIEYLGLRDLVGDAFIVHFRSKGLQAKFENGVPPWHVWSANPRMRAMVVCPNGGEDYVMHKGVPAAPGEDLSGFVQKFLNAPDVDLEIVQKGIWKPQFLVAETYGRGRIWIAGDAAHQYIPTGGMGMNTGIAEAYNLAWKLVAVLRGWGGKHLVESYDAERQPVALSTREHARRCAGVASALLHGVNDGDSMRVPVEVRADRMERLYFAWGAEFGYCYANKEAGNSPIIDAGDDPLPFYHDLEYRPTTRAGSRLPSLFREDGSAVFDLLDREGFTLLDLSGCPAAENSLTQAAEAKKVPLKVQAISEDYARDVYAADYVLVRPDEYVAWRGNKLPKNPEALIERVRGNAHA